MKWKKQASSPDVLFENISFGQVEEKMRQYETDLAQLAICCGFSLPCSLTVTLYNFISSCPEDGVNSELARQGIKMDKACGLSQCGKPNHKPFPNSTRNSPKFAFKAFINHVHGWQKPCLMGGWIPGQPHEFQKIRRKLLSATTRSKKWKLKAHRWSPTRPYPVGDSWALPQIFL